jgi:hypothetical protein
MSESIRCPDCGAENPADATSCGQCNFPIAGPGAPLAASAVPAPAPPAEPVSAGGTPPSVAAPPPAVTPAPPSPAATLPPPRRPIRPRRPRPQSASQALTIWLFVGGFAALLVIYMAIKANVDRARTPVEGANPDQQKQVDQLLDVVAKDSTNVDAQVALADLYYDTANWPQAIVHYRTATRLDSSRVTALVDLGVCYYNLGDTDTAANMFQLGLVRDPRQPVALFNLGIVSERRGDLEGALHYFHTALESGPPESMQQPLMQAIQRVQQQTGKSAPPIKQGP